MTKSFQYESFTCQVHIECRDRDGADASGVIEACDRDGHEVELTSLPAALQALLARKADELAQDYACEAAQEYAEGQADWLYDNWKDREIEGEE